MNLALSAIAFAIALTLIFWRPKGLNEAVGAGIGAVIALALRLVPLRDVARIFGETANVLLFLLGMMIVTGIVENAGVFDVLAAMAARTARGNGYLLLVNVFLLGALTTAFLSLDVTIIVLTPIVYVVVDRLEIDPVPYLFACVFVANTASLFLPIANLTNILMYDLLHLSFIHFAAIMFLPNLAALALNIALFCFIFRARIPPRFTTACVEAASRPRGFRFGAVGLAAVLIGLLLFGVAGLPLAIPALVGAAVLAAGGVRMRLVGAREIPAFVTWTLFPFVIAMFIVIRGIERAWLPHLPPIPTGTNLGTLLLVALGTGAGANIVNNIPMVVAMISVLRGAGATVPQHLAFATLIGTNIGPGVITFGSLATMLWLAIVRKRGLAVSAFSYLRVGLIATPLMIVAATVVLWLELRV